MEHYSFLEKHPFFYEKLRDDYLFELHKNVHIQLSVPRGFVPDKKNPIEHRIFSSNGFAFDNYSIEEYPFWFRTLYYQATEAYFYQHRVRAIFTPRHFDNIITTLSCLAEEEKLAEFFVQNASHRTLIIPLKETSFLENVEHSLKKWKMNFETKVEKEQIILIIQERKKTM
jgi:hypothetical protein